MQHGGKREGAGRKSRSGLKAHARRPQLTRYHPIHVAIRIHRGLPNIRRKDIFRIWRQAVRRARTKGFGVVHFALLGNHAHFIIEPTTSSIRAPMQSLCISFALRLNRHLNRKGEVFRGRYLLKVLKTATYVRDALAYVLTNEARHKGRRQNRPWQDFSIRLDPFSSASRYTKWNRLIRGRFKIASTGWSEDSIAGILNDLLVAPRTRLLMWIA